MQGGEHPGLAESVLELIGGTPIVKLKRLAAAHGVTATIAVKLVNSVRQSFERLRIVEPAYHETNAVGELLPCRLLEWRTAVRLHILLHKILEVLFGPITTGEPRQTEAWRQ